MDDYLTKPMRVDQLQAALLRCHSLRDQDLARLSA
jgi:DNA-binding response OmpR family regulator